MITMVCSSWGPRPTLMHRTVIVNATVLLKFLTVYSTVLLKYWPVNYVVLLKYVAVNSMFFSKNLISPVDIQGNAKHLNSVVIF